MSAARDLTHAPDDHIGEIEGWDTVTWMVIEWLTFDVDPEIREAWMAVEEANWSRYLERRPGFVGKQLWVEQGDPGQVHAVITWTDEASWHTVPAEDVERVDVAMGDMLRGCTMRVFDVVRNC